ncbi:hypothetical protein QTG54_006324 [Skeletonema marinoi]|uniref:Isopenicillin N synthase-like Fe(2+) 2OG dioxygenase domain-containing protein n=1 Tax=Skeletonema marinoi TaxID=267567 RepID=A0AAD8YAU3_9STRA|nr:hypothetical protein QTG54_006324 [Skeletonema marinoi]
MKIFSLIATAAGASVGILVVFFFSNNKNNDDASSFLRHHRRRLGLVYDPRTTVLKPPLEQLPKCPLRNLASFKNGRVGRKYFDAVPKTLEDDFGTITILASSEEGLEEIRDGRWYKVPMRKGELHVSVGEVYTMWSNGLFKNNIHRVSKEAKRDRISFPYFTSQGKLSSNESVMDDGISPICSDGEEPRFPRVSPKSHGMHYISVLTGKANE